MVPRWINAHLMLRSSCETSRLWFFAFFEKTFIERRQKRNEKLCIKHLPPQGEGVMEIWQEIVSMIISNGIFATLFVTLFFYQLKDSKSREEKYQNTISDLSRHLDVVEKIKEDVEELKQIANKRRRKNETKKLDSLI